jgi:molybdopterin synthase catalytic subunit
MQKRLFMTGIGSHSFRRFREAELYLTDAPIEYQALIDEVMRPADGALSFFAGVVRDHNEGKEVESIFYDSYREMAEREIASVVKEVQHRYPGVKIALQHRLGLLHVGECSIAIACSSPHRAEAFNACRELIDGVKARAPIWKKERSHEGEEWVGWQK